MEPSPLATTLGRSTEICGVCRVDLPNAKKETEWTKCQQCSICLCFRCAISLGEIQRFDGTMSPTRFAQDVWHILTPLCATNQHPFIDAKTMDMTIKYTKNVHARDTVDRVALKHHMIQLLVMTVYVLGSYGFVDDWRLPTHFKNIPWDYVLNLLGSGIALVLASTVIAERVSTKYPYMPHYGPNPLLLIKHAALFISSLLIYFWILLSPAEHGTPSIIIGIVCFFCYIGVTVVTSFCLLMTREGIAQLHGYNFAILGVRFFVILIFGYSGDRIFIFADTLVKLVLSFKMERYYQYAMWNDEMVDYKVVLVKKSIEVPPALVPEKEEETEIEAEDDETIAEQL